MTSVADSRGRGIDVEDESCSQWPPVPVAKDHGEWFDLVATDSFDVTGQSVDASGQFECKSCWNRYGSRQDRWRIPRKDHDRLVGSGSWYTLGALDREVEYILRMAVVHASRVDQPIDDRWTDCRRGGKGVNQYRQFAWSAASDPRPRPPLGVACC
jgi:hypothetical protein